ncbi:MAG: sigma-70 family RNA polymerase sigma factor [Oscillospiraceae bacterium]|jgi:RNA polymerase sporulation-specific sigma factor|nr:sigma-70 family RNA polymerase sigma factor [Oscillospiraceae bacterium]
MDEAVLTRIIAAQNGDREASGEILESNSGLVWSVARRFFGRGVDPDDLYQLGCVGFLKAIDGYDPEYGTQLTTYAVPKIAGEIRRFLRDDGSVKVSRAIKERAAAIRRARGELEQRLGREPTVSELSEALCLPIEEIASAQAATEAPSSLSDENNATELSSADTAAGSWAEDSVIERLALRDALRSLPERERQVIALRYYRGMTQSDAARVLKTTQVQISRMERRAMKKLRAMMED